MLFVWILNIPCGESISNEYITNNVSYDVEDTSIVEYTSISNCKIEYLKNI